MIRLIVLLVIVGFVVTVCSEINQGHSAWTERKLAEIKGPPKLTPEECRQNKECWVAKHELLGYSALKLVEQNALHEHRWESGKKISIINWNPETGEIIFAGDAISFRNALGVWSRQKYSIRVDAINSKLIDLKVLPGTFPNSLKK